jgi:virulence factor Mce-like protein
MPAPFRQPVSHRPSAATIVLAALASLGVLVALAYLAIVAPRGVPLLHYYDVKARFADASEITDLSQVRIAGRQVGQVTGSSYQAGHAIVSMSLYPGGPVLRSDTTARIRLNGLLGAKFVQLTPGQQGRLLPSGSMLPVSQTSSAVDIPTLLQMFNAPARQNLHTSLRGLGEGFVGRGVEINQMLSVAPSFYGRIGQLSQTVVTARPGAAARLFPSLDQLASAYQPVRQDLAAGFHPEARVMRAFQQSSPALRSTLDNAPTALTALQQGMSAATPLLDQTAGLARAVTALTKPAPAAMAQTTEFLKDAGPALARTKPALTNLAGAVPNTLTFLKAIDPVIPPAVVAMAESMPSLLNLGQHGCDLLSFAQNWRSSLAFGVPQGSGALGSGEAGLGALNSLRVVAVRALSELNADAPQPVRPHDAYPAPCAGSQERTP